MRARAPATEIVVSHVLGPMVVRMHRADVAERVRPAIPDSLDVGDVVVAAFRCLGPSSVLADILTPEPPVVRVADLEEVAVLGDRGVAERIIASVFGEVVRLARPN